MKISLLSKANQPSMNRVMLLQRDRLFPGLRQNDLPPQECPPESARDSLVLLDKEIESIQSGQVVRLY